jgi:ATP-dependent DNA helicase DinG
MVANAARLSYFSHFNNCYTGGVSGLLALSRLRSVLPNALAREGQERMLRAVERAFTVERPLLVEAGTGTGKTLAYLIPAVLSGRRVVVSTATHALQEQMIEKDIPLVRALLQDVPFEVRVMKGIGNYVCRRRFEEAFADGSLQGHAALTTWATETKTGDRAELKGSPRGLPRILSSSETRIGAGCKFYDTCFVTQMRKQAEDAQILIVNHHLFFADLALRMGPRGEYASAIPPYDAVIFDEAHHLEVAATDFFGERLALSRIDSVCEDAKRACVARSSLAIQALDLGQRFLAAFPKGDRRTLSPLDRTAPVREAEAKFLTALVALESACAAEEGGMSAARRIHELRGCVERIAAETEPREGEPVSAWIEHTDGPATLGISPVHVAPILERALWARVPTVVLTSATLTTAVSSQDVGSFHYIRNRLGAPDSAEELAVASPFRVHEKAMLYTPKDMPEPSSPAYEAAALERVQALLEITKGGAFILTTSNRLLTFFARALRSGPYTLLVQGESSKSELLAAFKEDGSAVLVATMSFWEGVDVPGDALRLVVLDKIPFPVPTDPTLSARAKAIEDAGGNPFMELYVPLAGIALKQGFGRLLRSETDAGLVAILDPRLMSKGYGRRLLAGLPPSRRAVKLEEVTAFWRALKSDAGESAASEVTVDR